jgi:hypothetical protein
METSLGAMPGFANHRETGAHAAMGVHNDEVR